VALTQSNAPQETWMFCWRIQEAGYTIGFILQLLAGITAEIKSFSLETTTMLWQG